MFQFMPLRKDIIMKNCLIDTKSIIELFVKKDKNKYLKDIQNQKKELWNKYFDIDVKINNYVFDYSIITDGYSVSIRFIHKDKLQEENLKKEKMKKGKDKFKGLTSEEKDKLKKKLTD